MTRRRGGPGWTVYLGNVAFAARGPREEIDRRGESTESRSESRPEWEQLEDWVRSQVQRLIQELLEEEVTAFLGRAKSALRSDSDNDTGYRNGYGRARRLTLSSGTIQLRRPRVRDTEEQFESRLLPLFVNRTRKVAELIPELYLHGLSEGDFDLALRGLLGEDAPVSASTVARLKSKWNDELGLCHWAPWFRTHYTEYDRAPSDFQLATWTAEHTQLLNELAKERSSLGESVYKEDQNHFRGRHVVGLQFCQ